MNFTAEAVADMNTWGQGCEVPEGPGGVIHTVSGQQGGKITLRMSLKMKGNETAG